MSNPWLVIAGAALILAALSWVFSFIIRGRYRAARPPRWTWLAATVGALLVFAALALAGTAAASAATVVRADYVDHYNYVGTRFQDMTAPICVEDRANQVRAAGRSKYIRYAVYEINDRTAARVYYRYGDGSCAGTGYTYRVIVVDGDYDFSAWIVADVGPQCSATKRTGCIKWGQTAAGNSTWLVSGYSVLRLDTDGGKSHLIPASKKPWVHELGHAILGLDDYPTNVYGTRTCNSVMAYCYTGSGLHSNDIAWFNKIRVQ